MPVSHKCTLPFSFTEQSGICVSSPSYVYYGAGILTGYGLNEESWFESSEEQDTGFRAFQPPMQLAAGSFTLKVKRPTPEAHHSPQPSDEFSTEWSYISAAPYNFMAWRGKTFTFMNIIMVTLSRRGWGTISYVASSLKSAVSGLRALWWRGRYSIYWEEQKFRIPHIWLHLKMFS